MALSLQQVRDMYSPEEYAVLIANRHLLRLAMLRGVKMDAVTELVKKKALLKTKAT